MATEVNIPEPVCDTIMEVSVLTEDQAQSPLDKFPQEEVLVPAKDTKLHLTKGETFLETRLTGEDHCEASIISQGEKQLERNASEETSEEITRQNEVENKEFDLQLFSGDENQVKEKQGDVSNEQTETIVSKEGPDELRHSAEEEIQEDRTPRETITDATFESVEELNKNLLNNSTSENKESEKGDEAVTTQVDSELLLENPVDSSEMTEIVTAQGNPVVEDKIDESLAEVSGLQILQDGQSEKESKHTEVSEKDTIDDQLTFVQETINEVGELKKTEFYKTEDGETNSGKIEPEVEKKVESLNVAPEDTEASGPGQEAGTSQSNDQSQTADKVILDGNADDTTVVGDEPKVNTLEVQAIIDSDEKTEEELSKVDGLLVTGDQNIDTSASDLAQNPNATPSEEKQTTSVDLVDVKEELLEQENVATTEVNLWTLVDDSQMKHEEHIEKEIVKQSETESFTEKANDVEALIMQDDAQLGDHNLRESEHFDTEDNEEGTLLEKEIANPIKETPTKPEDNSAYSLSEDAEQTYSSVKLIFTAEDQATTARQPDNAPEKELTPEVNGQIKHEKHLEEETEISWTEASTTEVIDAGSLVMHEGQIEDGSVKEVENSDGEKGSGSVLSDKEQELTSVGTIIDADSTNEEFPSKSEQSSSTTEKTENEKADEAATTPEHSELLSDVVPESTIEATENKVNEEGDEAATTPGHSEFLSDPVHESTIEATEEKVNETRDEAATTPGHSEFLSDPVHESTIEATKNKVNEEGDESATTPRYSEMLSDIVHESAIEATENKENEKEDEAATTPEDSELLLDLVHKPVTEATENKENEQRDKAETTPGQPEFQLDLVHKSATEVTELKKPELSESENKEINVGKAKLEVEKAVEESLKIGSEENEESGSGKETETCSANDQHPTSDTQEVLNGKALNEAEQMVETLELKGTINSDEKSEEKSDEIDDSQMEEEDLRKNGNSSDLVNNSMGTTNDNELTLPWVTKMEDQNLESSESSEYDKHNEVALLKEVHTEEQVAFSHVELGDSKITVEDQNTESSNREVSENPKGLPSEHTNKESIYLADSEETLEQEVVTNDANSLSEEDGSHTEHIEKESLTEALIEKANDEEASAMNELQNGDKYLRECENLKDVEINPEPEDGKASASTEDGCSREPEYFNNEKDVECNPVPEINKVPALSEGTEQTGDEYLGESENLNNEKNVEINPEQEDDKVLASSEGREQIGDEYLKESENLDNKKNTEIDPEPADNRLLASNEGTEEIGEEFLRESGNLDDEKNVDSSLEQGVNQVPASSESTKLLGDEYGDFDNLNNEKNVENNPQPEVDKVSTSKEGKEQFFPAEEQTLKEDAQVKTINKTTDVACEELNAKEYVSPMTPENEFTNETEAISPGEALAKESNDVQALVINEGQPWENPREAEYSNSVKEVQSVELSKEIEDSTQKLPLEEKKSDTSHVFTTEEQNPDVDPQGIIDNEATDAPDAEEVTVEKVGETIPHGFSEDSIKITESRGETYLKDEDIIETAWSESEKVTESELMHKAAVEEKPIASKQVPSDDVVTSIEGHQSQTETCSMKEQIHTEISQENTSDEAEEETFDKSDTKEESLKDDAADILDRDGEYKPENQVDFTQMKNEEHLVKDVESSNTHEDEPTIADDVEDANSTKANSFTNETSTGNVLAMEAQVRSSQEETEVTDKSVGHQDSETCLEKQSPTESPEEITEYQEQSNRYVVDSTQVKNEEHLKKDVESSNNDDNEPTITEEVEDANSTNVKSFTNETVTENILAMEENVRSSPEKTDAINKSASHKDRETEESKPYELEMKEETTDGKNVLTGVEGIQENSMTTVDGSYEALDRNIENVSETSHLQETSKENADESSSTEEGSYIKDREICDGEGKDNGDIKDIIATSVRETEDQSNETIGDPEDNNAQENEESETTSTELKMQKIEEQQNLDASSEVEEESLNEIASEVKPNDIVPEENFESKENKYEANDTAEVELEEKKIVEKEDTENQHSSSYKEEVTIQSQRKDEITNAESKEIIEHEELERAPELANQAHIKLTEEQAKTYDKKLEETPIRNNSESTEPKEMMLELNEKMEIGTCSRKDEESEIKTGECYPNNSKEELIMKIQSTNQSQHDDKENTEAAFAVIQNTNEDEKVFKVSEEADIKVADEEDKAMEANELTNIVPNPVEQENKDIVEAEELGKDFKYINLVQISDEISIAEEDKIKNEKPDHEAVELKSETEDTFGPKQTHSEAKEIAQIDCAYLSQEIDHAVPSSIDREEIDENELPKKFLESTAQEPDESTKAEVLETLEEETAEPGFEDISSKVFNICEQTEDKTSEGIVKNLETKAESDGQVRPKESVVQENISTLDTPEKASSSDQGYIKDEGDGPISSNIEIKEILEPKDMDIDIETISKVQSCEIISETKDAITEKGLEAVAVEKTPDKNPSEDRLDATKTTEEAENTGEQISSEKIDEDGVDMGDHLPDSFCKNELITESKLEVLEEANTNKKLSQIYEEPENSVAKLAQVSSKNASTSLQLSEQIKDKDVETLADTTREPQDSDQDQQQAKTKVSFENESISVIQHEASSEYSQSQCKATQPSDNKDETAHSKYPHEKGQNKAEHEDANTDEETGDKAESGEQIKHSSGPEALVMVDAGDLEVKTAHKKTHNLLSGVGSKVKHSIAKVKKVITGKSSHHKPPSPPKH